MRHNQDIHEIWRKGAERMLRRELECRDSLHVAHVVGDDGGDGVVDLQQGGHGAGRSVRLWLQWLLLHEQQPSCWIHNTAHLSHSM